MAVWDAFLSERDKKIFGQAGFGHRIGFGKHPALLIVDVNYDFTGHQPESIEESVKLWNHSCGQEAWDAIPYIQRLLSGFRDRHLPIIYTTSGDTSPDGFEWGIWRNKDARITEETKVEGYPKNEIVREIQPMENEIVIEKYKPSAFHGTPLLMFLNDLRVDGLVICGTTTSGCVRASVVDGFSYNYRISIAEEATFDRGQASHAINLFDMNQKYADVLTVNEILTKIDRLPKFE